MTHNANLDPDLEQLHSDAISAVDKQLLASMEFDLGCDRPTCTHVATWSAQYQCCKQVKLYCHCCRDGVMKQLRKLWKSRLEHQTMRCSLCRRPITSLDKFVSWTAIDGGSR